ncbi:unnamed protein product [Paramecium pentaurelia]|uniref:Uncharacterized protein n=1 Tax=Paramecium pentaurelia TaxID=43138 RepID=A0A8S1YID6_9CILI|nr:unnamed protein product [Paramecium pentaurelia]
MDQMHIINQFSRSLIQITYLLKVLTQKIYHWQEQILQNLIQVNLNQQMQIQNEPIQMYIYYYSGKSEKIQESLSYKNFMVILVRFDQSPDDSTLAPNRTIKIKIEWPFQLCSISLPFSDVYRLASGSDEKCICLRDIERRQQKLRLDGHASSVGSVCFSPGNTLASVSWDNSIMEFQLRKINLTIIFILFNQYQHHIYIYISISRDGVFLATCDNMIKYKLYNHISLLIQFIQ